MNWALCMTEGLNNNIVSIFQRRTLKVKEVSFPRLTVAAPGFEPRQSGSGCNHCVILPLMVRKVALSGVEGEKSDRMDWFLIASPQNSGISG